MSEDRWRHVESFSRGTGTSAKARGAYAAFLHLWKDADQDVPVLRQLKAESARLK
jgi:hypothetical protein